MLPETVTFMIEWPKEAQTCQPEQSDLQSQGPWISVGADSRVTPQWNKFCYIHCKLGKQKITTRCTSFVLRWNEASSSLSSTYTVSFSRHWTGTSTKVAPFREKTLEWESDASKLIWRSWGLTSFLLLWLDSMNLWIAYKLGNNFISSNGKGHLSIQFFNIFYGNYFKKIILWQKQTKKKKEAQKQSGAI